MAEMWIQLKAIQEMVQVANEGVASMRACQERISTKILEIMPSINGDEEESCPQPTINFDEENLKPQRESFEENEQDALEMLEPSPNVELMSLPFEEKNRNKENEEEECLLNKDKGKENSLFESDKVHASLSFFEATNESEDGDEEKEIIVTSLMGVERDDRDEFESPMKMYEEDPVNNSNALLYAFEVEEESKMEILLDGFIVLGDCEDTLVSVDIPLSDNDVNKRSIKENEELLYVEEHLTSFSKEAMSVMPLPPPKPPDIKMKVLNFFMEDSKLYTPFPKLNFVERFEKRMVNGSRFALEEDGDAAQRNLILCPIKKAFFAWKRRRKKMKRSHPLKPTYREKPSHRISKTNQRLGEEVIKEIERMYKEVFKDKIPKYMTTLGRDPSKGLPKVCFLT